MGKLWRRREIPGNHTQRDVDKHIWRLTGLHTVGLNPPVSPEESENMMTVERPE